MFTVAEDNEVGVSTQATLPMHFKGKTAESWVLGQLSAPGGSEMWVNTLHENLLKLWSEKCHARVLFDELDLAISELQAAGMVEMVQGSNPKVRLV